MADAANRFVESLTPWQREVGTFAFAVMSGTTGTTRQLIEMA